MRQEGILADNKDISAYLLDTGDSERKIADSPRTLCKKLERYILNHIPDESLQTSYKQLNDNATNSGINTSKENGYSDIALFPLCQRIRQKMKKTLPII